MGSVDNKSMFWLPLENNYCSSWIAYKMTAMLSIIKLLYCNTTIDNLDSHTSYFDVFVWKSCSMLEELRNITIQPILSSAEDPYGILIGKAPKLFLVTRFQYKSSCVISKCLIWDLDFTIEIICISICGLNYDVHVVTCLHKFRISYHWSIFINLDECNFLILITQCSDKKV